MAHDLLTEGALDHIELDGIGKLLALTGNDEVNSLTALHFGRILGGGRVYQLPPDGLDADSQKVVSRNLRGRFLFDRGASYWNLTARFDAGAEIKTTNLTEAFDFEKFKELHRIPVPLFLIDDGGPLDRVHREGSTATPAGRQVGGDLRPGERGAGGVTSDTRAEQHRQ